MTEGKVDIQLPPRNNAAVKDTLTDVPITEWKNLTPFKGAMRAVRRLKGIPESVVTAEAIKKDLEEEKRRIRAELGLEELVGEFSVDDLRFRLTKKRELGRGKTPGDELRRRYPLHEGLEFNSSNEPIKAKTVEASGSLVEAKMSTGDIEDLMEKGIELQKLGKINSNLELRGVHPNALAQLIESAESSSKGDQDKSELKPDLDVNVDLGSRDEMITLIEGLKAADKFPKDIPVDNLTDNDLRDLLMQRIDELVRTGQAVELEEPKTEDLKDAEALVSEIKKTEAGRNLIEDLRSGAAQMKDREAVEAYKAGLQEIIAKHKRFTETVDRAKEIWETPMGKAAIIRYIAIHGPELLMLFQPEGKIASIVVKGARALVAAQQLSYQFNQTENDRMNSCADATINAILGLGPDEKVDLATAAQGATTLGKEGFEWLFDQLKSHFVNQPSPLPPEGTESEVKATTPKEDNVNKFKESYKFYSEVRKLRDKALNNYDKFLKSFKDPLEANTHPEYDKYEQTKIDAQSLFEKADDAISIFESSQIEAILGITVNEADSLPNSEGHYAFLDLRRATIDYYSNLIETGNPQARLARLEALLTKFNDIIKKNKPSYQPMEVEEFLRRHPSFVEPKIT